MSPPDLGRCLCLVTDRGFRPASEFLSTVELAIDNGVTMVQYREKADLPGRACLSDLKSYRLGRQLRELTKAKRVRLLVNDRLDLAMAIDADGVHLGQTDLPLPVARTLWQPGRIYGLSVTTIEEARVASRDGADYLGVGTVFPTASKRDAPSAGLEMLGKIVAETRLPVIAIGGIGVDNASRVMQTGCAGIAVVSAIWGAQDPSLATRMLAAAIGA
jgi:thiamine-phosphate pyrophosphorylase